MDESKKLKIQIYIVIFLFVSFWGSFAALRKTAQGSGLLSVYFLDVNQGDSIFIESPTGNQILIDGGPDSSVVNRLSEIMPFYDRSIDVIILTHAHADHVSGLIDVLKKYQVGNIFESEITFDTAEYREWNDIKQKSKVIQTKTGQIIDTGDGVLLKILFPFRSGIIPEKVKNPHDFMVVSKLIYGDESLMLTGDMETKVERELVDSGLDLKSDFLKVGHHGSKTSTSDNFLKSVQPEVAFISVGAKNRYGHPNRIILDRLENHDIKYYRTDIDETIKLITDGNSYTISTVNRPQ